MISSRTPSPNMRRPATAVVASRRYCNAVSKCCILSGRKEATYSKREGDLQRLCIFVGVSHISVDLNTVCQHMKTLAFLGAIYLSYIWENAMAAPRRHEQTKRKRQR